MTLKAVSTITLTSDFGLKDPYTAVMKGVIISIFPQAIVIDLTHEVTPGVITEAAWILLDSYAYFPHGTVHLAVVDPGVGKLPPGACH